MLFLHQLILTWIAILTYEPVTVVAQLPSPRSNAAHAIDPRLSVILQANAEISQEKELKETIAWIDSLRSAPACTQLASSKLITDCQLLDHPTDFAKVNPHQSLEDVQNEYALKLAICEFVGAEHANSKPPPNCHAFLPSKEACVKRSWLWSHAEASHEELCYPMKTKTDMPRCLATMRSSPQTWTSYSNARIRAMHICHLSRQHIDKEEALHLYKNLTLVVSKLYESVQPLEARFNAMEHQLQRWSSDTERFFEESQSAAKGFTQFAKEAQNEHQHRLRETNQSIRDIRSQVEAMQAEANEHYDALNARLEARVEASLVKGTEVVASYQADALAQFSNSMGVIYQSLTRELSAQFARYNAELQEYHEKNILAIQQQHETQVRSFDILQEGINSATSTVKTLNDRTTELKADLEETIVQVGTVNDVLGTFASIAQAVRQFLPNLGDILTYVCISGIVVVFVSLASCISNVPLIGQVVYKLMMILLLLATCSIAVYVGFRSFIVPRQFKKSATALIAIKIGQQGF